jgi:hypothetical protein
MEIIQRDKAKDLIHPEIQPFQLDHITKMTALAATNESMVGQGFFYFKPESTNVDDPSRFGVKALVRHLRGVKQESIPEEKNFKLHLMPKPDQIADTAVELAAMLDSDPNFRGSVYGYKVQAMISKDEQMGENPTPDIIVYPRHDVRSVAQTMHSLQKRFANREGRGLIPRFNTPVNESSMLFMAEGHGHEKKDLFDFDRAELDASFDAGQNYAFSKEDASLIKRIRELAATMD